MPDAAPAGQAKRAVKFLPSQGRCEGTAASALARHGREHREPFHAGGARRATRKGQGGWSGRMAAETERRCARWEGKRSGRSRGGVSEAKALAGAGRGAVRAKRGGDAATARGAPRPQAGARRHAPLVERPCGRTADAAMSLARRAARRDARRGSCVRSGGGQGERSEGAGLRLRQRPAGSRPARYCGAEPHRRAETGKAGLATWTAAGKRRMSVVRDRYAQRAKPSGARCAETWIVAHDAGWKSRRCWAGRRHAERRGRRWEAGGW